MKYPDAEVIVVDIAGNKARLVVTDEKRIEALQEIGFERQGDQFVRVIVDDNDRKALVRALIRLDAVFSGGAGWSPSDLLQYYVKQGEEFNGYRMISWSGKDSYSIH